MSRARLPIADRLRFAWPWAAMLAAAVYLYRVAGHFAYAPRPGELGPDVWPRAIVVLLIVVCGLRLVGYLLGFAAAERDGADPDPVPDDPDLAAAGAAEEGETVLHPARAAVDEPPADTDEAATPRHPRLLYAGIVLTILYVLSMGTLGFFLSTALYLALFMLVGRYRRFRVIAISSLVGSLAFVYVFMKIVYVSLPLGTGPFERLSLAVLAAIGVH